MKRWYWLFLAALIAGCTPSATKTSGTTTSGTPTASTSTGTTGTTAPPETKAPTVADIPASLKHEGFRYYGLGNEKSVNMISREAGKPDKKGSVELTLDSLEGEKATFTQAFTGELAELGQSKIMVDPNGVFSIDLGGAPLDQPQKELPADAKPGDTWKIDKPTKAGPSTIQKFDSKIIGIEKVTVPLGTFDGLKVVADVVLESGGKKTVAKMTAWYVKDMGTVKLSMVFTEGGKTQQRTLLATK